MRRVPATYGFQDPRRERVDPGHWGMRRGKLRGHLMQLLHVGRWALLSALSGGFAGWLSSPLPVFCHGYRLSSSCCRSTNLVGVFLQASWYTCISANTATVLNSLAWVPEAMSIKLILSCPPLSWMGVYGARSLKRTVLFGNASPGSTSGPRCML